MFVCLDIEEGGGGVVRNLFIGLRMVLQFLGNSSQSQVNLTKKCFNFCNYIIRLSLCLIRCLRKRKVFITSRAHCRI